MSLLSSVLILALGLYFCERAENATFGMNDTWHGASEETGLGCHCCQCRQWWGVTFKIKPRPRKFSRELWEISGEKWKIPRILQRFVNKVKIFRFLGTLYRRLEFLRNMNQCRIVRWTAESLEPVSILLGLIISIQLNTMTMELRSHWIRISVRLDNGQQTVQRSQVQFSHQEI